VDHGAANRRLIHSPRAGTMRGCVLACFVLSVLAPPLVQAAQAARLARAPWLEVCSNDPRQPAAPARDVSAWLAVRTALAVPRPKIRRA
jgi:hypothetical protein